MKVNKEEIQRIDDYLKKGGIKYWDVRLEMVDHLVSDIESYEGSADFETLFKQSLINANWHNNLKAVNTQSWKTTNKIYRKKHSKEIISVIKDPVNLLFFILFYLGINWIAQSFPKMLKPLFFVVLFLPFVIMTYEFIKSWLKKLGRSVNMDYGFFYFSFGIFITNLPIQLIPKAQQSIWLPIILTLYLIVMFAGYRVYKYALKKVLIMKSVT
ncbi:hypothetical protein DFQ05_1561 [Winogradskyella wandonensis]|uniref:Uncharacterized protein n=1 Tax=Winogradskyella wandonensis TaxID=1442586 RepID=A0A4R1KT89_9FLAO|nr:hypothetical protein [Winogradskyella wandonensis]TCK67780.1 hypothetical protein DFQ05_1561 [Winogradskyella wandonensis]